MKAGQRISTALALMAGGVTGWFAHSSSVVRAASDSGPAEFQLQGTGPAAELGIYFPADKDLYVYPGIAAGSSMVNCAFKLHIARAGDPIERTNCGVGKR